MRRIGLLLLLAAGCASGGSRLAQMDADALLDHAVERQASGKWNDASRAFEQFIFQFPTHPRYEEARFRLATVYFEKDEYLTAASEYTRLADDYSTSEFADDARFGACNSYYRLSPRAQLDQQYTRTALDYCQAMVAFFPESEFAERTRTMMAELEQKLAQKVFLNGEFYFKRNGWDSAIIYFNDVLELYPTTPAAARSLLRLYESYQQIGYVEEAKETRERLLRDFPESAEARQVKGDTATAGS